MKYLKKFDTHTEYESFIGEGTYEKHTVSMCVKGKHSHFDEPDYSQRYLTFIALEDGTFKFSGNSINYSLDNGETWVSLANNTDTPTITAGSRILWKASLTPRTSWPDGIGKFISSGNFDAEGNPISLLYGDNFKGVTSLSNKAFAFCYLFMGSKMVNAKNIKLIATTLASNCYMCMFSGCGNLISTPELPATTLAGACYADMFRGCRNLTKVPKLPATVMSNMCYSGMFSYCHSLTGEMLPELPATTLAAGCYYDMFYFCDGLNVIPENYLPNTTLADDCYHGMFQSCHNLTTAPKLPATTLKPTCYYSMFDDCTKLTTPPELPSTTLANSCYENMFYGCTSLTTAPVLPATTLVSGCYDFMFYDCSNLNYIKAMFTTTPGDSYTDCWCVRVSNSGTFVKNSAATWTNRGISSVPTNWTIETASD